MSNEEVRECQLGLFRSMITPWLVNLVFGLAVLGWIVSMIVASEPFWKLVWGVTGLIFILGCRLACEAVLVLFQIRDKLAEIQKELKA